MKIGVSAFAWTGSFDMSHLPLLTKVREYGFDGFEIPMFLPKDLPVAAMRRAFEAAGLDCTICAILPAPLNPISPDPAIRKHSLTHLAECVETAAELGSHLLGGPLFAPIGYLPTHRPTGDEWTWAVEAFQSLGDLLEQYEITLSIEPVNRSETFFLRTAADAMKLCRAIDHPRIGATIDTFHANIEEKRVPSAIESLGTHLRHMHLSENDRGVLGTGHLDFTGCIEAMKRIDYTGYLVIEGFGYLPEETTSPGALYADLHVSPEDIALQSLAYLKSLVG